MGPGGPLIALLIGGLLGGMAGGTAGGVYTCSVEGDHYVIKYLPEYIAPGQVSAPGYNHHLHPNHHIHQTYLQYAKNPSYSYYPYRQVFFKIYLLNVKWYYGLYLDNQFKQHPSSKIFYIRWKQFDDQSIIRSFSNKLHTMTTNGIDFY